MNLFYPRLQHTIAAGEDAKWIQISALMVAADASQAGFMGVAQFFIRATGDLRIHQVLPGKKKPGESGGPTLTDTTIAIDQVAGGEYWYRTMEGSPGLDYWDLSTIWVMGATGTLFYCNGVTGQLIQEDIK